MLVQRRVERQVVVLRNANDELRFLLHINLDDLFQLEAAV
jgi:hypothetical protein